MSFRNYLQPKRDEIDREREKKKFTPEFHSYSTQEENSEKNSKKIQKIKKPLSGIIYSRNWMRKAEKAKKKKFRRIFRSFSAWGKKFRKKLQKNLKSPFRHNF